MPPSGLVAGALSAPAPARQRRLGLGLARTRRAHRARRRAEDRRRARARRRPRRARGRGRRAPRHQRCLRAYGLDRDDAHVYIAYEYVPGTTLRQALRAGELDDASAVEAAAQVLEGLAHAHARGIVHRDVKPSNVLLAEGGRALRAPARLRAGAARRGRHADRGRRRARARSPTSRPSACTASRRAAPADVWAVGVLLWEALAGCHPFWTARCSRRAKRIQTRRAVARQRAARPAGAALERRRPRARGRPAARGRPRGARRLRAPRRLASARAPARRRAAAAASSSRDALRRIASRRALAALVAGWTAATLPFFPAGWPLGSSRRSPRALTLLRPRLGLAFALAVPVLPLGNVSLGPRLAYAASPAPGSRSCGATRARGLLFAAGPLLAPLAALGLLPLAALPVRIAGRARAPRPRRRARGRVAGTRRRAAAVRRRRRAAARIAGSDDPLAVPRARWHALGRPGAPARGRDPRRGRRRAPLRRARPLGSPARRRADRGDAARRAGWPPSRSSPPPGYARWRSPAPPVERRRSRRPAAGLRCRIGSRARAGGGWCRVASRDCAAGAGVRLGRGVEPRPMSVLRNIEHKIEAPLRGCLRPRLPHATSSRSSSRASSSRRWTTTAWSRSRASTSPNEYTIYLSPADREQFSSYEDSLRASCRSTSPSTRAARATRCSRRRAVQFETDDDLDDRRVRDRHAHGAAGAAAAASRAAPAGAAAGATMIYKPQSPPRREAAPPRSSALGRRSSRSTSTATSARARQAAAS